MLRGGGTLIYLALVLYPSWAGRSFGGIMGSVHAIPTTNRRQYLYYGLEFVEKPARTLV